MKITIDIDKQDEFPRYFENQEEWDDYPYSPEGRRRHWREGTYLPLYSNVPSRFPCYCFEGTFIYRPNGPDEYANYFIYPELDNSQ